MHWVSKTYKKGYFILYIEKNTRVLLEKGVFYWTSKSAISVLKSGVFVVQNPRKGFCFQIWVQARIYVLVGSRGTGISLITAVF